MTGEQSPTSSLNWEYLIPAISANIRERQPGEITPVSAEQSQTYDDNEKCCAASHAIDLDLNTWSYTTYGSSWLKVKLEKTFCILQVVSYYQDGNPLDTWTCSSTKCSACEGDYGCYLYSLTVSSERTSSDGRPLVSDCKYGDTVMIERTDGGAFSAAELAVIGKQGENIR